MESRPATARLVCWLVSAGLLLLLTGCHTLYLERVVFTEKLANLYQSNDPELLELDFCLSEPLVLIPRNRETANPDQSPQQRGSADEEELVFDTDLTGKCIQIMPAHKKYSLLPSVRSMGLNWTPMKLRINFDEKDKRYLIFVANDQGDFILETISASQVQYGDQILQCAGGCSRRVLLLERERREELK